MQWLRNIYFYDICICLIRIFIKNDTANNSLFRIVRIFVKKFICNYGNFIKYFIFIPV